MPFPHRIPTRTGKAGWMSPAFTPANFVAAMDDFEPYIRTDLISENTTDELERLGTIDGNRKWNIFVSFILKAGVDHDIILEEQAILLRRKQPIPPPFYKLYHDNKGIITPKRNKPQESFFHAWPASEDDVADYNCIIEELEETRDNGFLGWEVEPILGQVETQLQIENKWTLKWLAEAKVSIPDTNTDKPDTMPMNLNLIDQTRKLSKTRDVLVIHNILPKGGMNAYIQCLLYAIKMYPALRRKVDHGKPSRLTIVELLLQGKIHERDLLEAEKEVGVPLVYALPEWAVDATQFEKEMLLMTKEGEASVEKARKKAKQAE